MDELKRVAVFTQVVEAKSFSEAARRLGVAKSAVSKQISLLEKEVGVRLINRSPRQLSLTEAGDIFYRHCAEIVHRAEIARSELRQYQNQPTGTLRVTSPIDFGTSQLVPVVKQLRGLYPQLKIELLFEDRVVNMVEEGVDLAIRVGWMQESNLVAKPMGHTPLVVFAAPEYVAKHGTPQTPKALVEHQWLALSLFPAPLRWQFPVGDTKQLVQMHSSLKANSAEAVVAMAKAGLGVSVIAKYAIEDELKSGQLVQLLADFPLDPIGIYAVYAHRDHVPPKVRVFMEFLSKRCVNASWAI